MEKYCPKCHKIYNDINAKFCTNCATELITRKQEPHQNEAEYQIQIKNKKKELSDLQNQLHDAENKLKDATDEDEILEYKFIIKKLKNENIPNIQKELDKLTQEEKRIKSEIKKEQEESNRREKLFKELYVEFDAFILDKACAYFHLTESSTEDNLRLLVSKHSKHEIYNIITKIIFEEEKLKKREVERKRKENEQVINSLIQLYGIKFCPNCNEGLPTIADECYICKTKLK